MLSKQTHTQHTSDPSMHILMPILANINLCYSVCVTLRQDNLLCSSTTVATVFCVSNIPYQQLTETNGSENSYLDAHLLNFQIISDQRAFSSRKTQSSVEDGRRSIERSGIDRMQAALKRLAASSTYVNPKTGGLRHIFPLSTTTRMTVAANRA